MRVHKINKYVARKQRTEASTFGGGSGVGPTPEYNNGNSGAAATINWNNGPNQRITLTANCTVTFTNPVVGAAYILFFKQDGVGGWSAIFPAEVRWSFAVAPAFTSVPGHLDWVNLYYNGSKYIASSLSDFDES